MSWKKFPKYKRDNRIDVEEEYESQFDYLYGYRDQYEHENAPTMKEVRTGWLLSLLDTLGLKSAKIPLKHWYW
jgi:hypothetical protein